MSSLFDTIHPYYQAILNVFRELDRPQFHQLTPEEGRAMLRAGTVAAPLPTDLPELAEVRDFPVPGPHGPIPVRRYVSKGPALGTCIYFHAGGWVIGDLDFCDATCRRLADATGCEIISVDFRMAPEHPFPVPLDDCYAVVEWAARERKGKLAVFGESAGGNLAAACAIKARNAAGPAIAAQVLAYPVTDHDFETPSYAELGGRGWMLTTADMRFFWDHYCPEGTDRTDPLASPLHLANAAGLPPAFICVAQLDPLRDEGLAYARKLASAGVEVETRCDPGVLHGYLAGAAAVPQSAEALASVAAWLRRHLA